MDNKYIYLVFAKTGTWLSHSISTLTKTDYPHIALSLDPKFDKLYTFGRVNVNNPFSGGLTIESLYSGIYSRSKNAQCLIYKIPVTVSEINLLKMELEAYYLINDIDIFKYNFIGLFGVLFNMPLKRKHHYFCSQFVSTLLANSGIWTSPKPHELTRPTDIMKITNKEIIYEGLVHELNLSSKEVALST